MQLIEKKDQHRRDFTGVYQCEGCDASAELRYCYDDTNFHENVMPDAKCDKCGESTNSMGLKPKEVATEYPEGMQV